MTSVQQQICETVCRHRMVTAGDRVGVAVSGGADSVALLLLLEELRSQLGITLLLMHFNHQLRGADSAADERFVAELAAAHGLEFLSAREDVAAEARREGINLEEAARRSRYAFFARAVESRRVTRVAVGHTMDDQAETILAHLLRGTGHAGLAGIYPVVGHVVRPLLDVRRPALREYLASRGQSWREDQTNLDTSRLRSRIRHMLLPRLEQDFQFAVVEHLGELARLARVEEAFWAALLDDRVRALVTQTEAGLSIRIPDLLSPLPLALPETERPQALRALTQRLVRRIVQEVKGDRRQLTAQHVEQVIRLATETTSGHSIQLPDGVVAERSFDRLIFARPNRARPNRAGQEDRQIPAVRFRDSDGVHRSGFGPRLVGATGPVSGLRWSPPDSRNRRLQESETPEIGASRGTAAGKVAYEYAVDLAQEGSAAVVVPEIGLCYRLKVIDWSAEPRETRTWEKALDADLVRPPLVLRNWRPGDAYRPCGSRNVQKLKHLFLDRRIAAGERARWPVLTSVGRLVWARGLPPAADYVAGPGTRAALVIDEEVL